MPRAKPDQARRSKAGDPSLISNAKAERASPREDPVLSELQIGKDARTLGANVTNALRNAIIRGRLPPGQSLGQEYLARLFDVSRVPIRESLKQLAAEGLVELEPHRGAIVANLSLDELDELYAIIWALESLAARIGVPRLSDADISTMAQMIDRLEIVSDPADWYELSVSFHRVILIASRWKQCLRIVDECRKNIGRYIVEESFFSAHVAEWRQRNRALLEACRRRDVDAALQALDVMRRFSTAQVRDHVKELLDSRQGSAV